MLKLFGHAEEADQKGTDTVPHMEEPLPIQYRHREVQTSDGPMTLSYLIWFNADAAKCRRCTAGECNFLPNPAGIGSCMISREGKLGRSSPFAGRG